MGRKKTQLPAEPSPKDLPTRLRIDLAAARQVRRRLAEQLVSDLEHHRDNILDAIERAKNGRRPSSCGVFQGNATATDILCARLKEQDDLVETLEALAALAPPGEKVDG